MTFSGNISIHIKDKLSVNDYSLFDLPQTYQLSLKTLTENYLKLQNMIHPDRYAQSSPQEQRMAMQWATRINQAYTRLKHPTERAVYWCELHGETPKNPQTPLHPNHLAQHMAWHEALEDLDHANTTAAFKPLRQEVQAAQTKLYQNITQAADHDHDVTAACQYTQALLYIDKFLQELDRRVEHLEDTL